MPADPWLRRADACPCCDALCRMNVCSHLLCPGPLVGLPALLKLACPSVRHHSQGDRPTGSGASPEDEIIALLQTNAEILQ